MVETRAARPRSAAPGMLFGRISLVAMALLLALAAAGPELVAADHFTSLGITTPTSSVVGASTQYRLAFRIHGSTQWTNTGTIAIDFPDTADISSATGGTLTGCGGGTGSFSATVGRDESLKILTLTRSGAGSCASNEDAVITVDSVLNPTVSGANSITVTLNNGATQLEQGSASVTLTEGALDHVHTTPTPVTLTVGDTQTFTAAGHDQYHNAVSITPAWSVASGVGSIDSGSGLYTAGTTSGTGTVRASAGGKTGDASVTVSPGAVSASTSTVGATSPVTANGVATSTVTVTLRDAFSNVVPGKFVALASTRGASDSITQAASATDANGQATGTVASTVAGSSTISATDTTDSLAITQTASVSFVAGPVATLAITNAATTQTAGATSQVTYTATAVDANNNAVALDSATGVTWTIAAAGGSFSQNVLTPTNTAGTYTVTATLNSDNTKTDTETFTVQPGAPASITIANAATTQTAGATTQVTYAVSSVDGSGNAVTLNSATQVTWAISSGGGSFSQNVLTPGNTAATYTVTATLDADNTKTDTES
ncbi:MAG: Ig-like domain-containing protein, partial [Euryarchaeota archaeon]|nr:Ig-like domain-containing protein [Euryarchaeota archaeon]